MTLSYSIIDLVHVEVLDIWSENSVEQLRASMLELEVVDVTLMVIRTTFKTSFPGSNHHIVARRRSYVFQVLLKLVVVRKGVERIGH